MVDEISAVYRSIRRLPPKVRKKSSRRWRSKTTACLAFPRFLVSSLPSCTWERPCLRTCASPPFSEKRQFNCRAQSSVPKCNLGTRNREQGLFSLPLRPPIIPAIVLKGTCDWVTDSLGFGAQSQLLHIVSLIGGYAGRWLCAGILVPLAARSSRRPGASHQADCRAIHRAPRTA